jgi:hypothetical protein
MGGVLPLHMAGKWQPRFAPNNSQCMHAAKHRFAPNNSCNCGTRSILEERSKLKIILTKSLVYPPLTEWSVCHVRPTCQSSDMEGKRRRNLEYGKEGCLSPLSSSSPRTFFTQSVPTSWASVHVSWRRLYATVHVLKLSNTVHTTPISPTNHDHAQIYFPFVSPLQIEPNRVFVSFHSHKTFLPSFLSLI